MYLQLPKVLTVETIVCKPKVTEIGCCFSVVHCERSCSPLVYTEPFSVTLFWLHIQAYWKVCCISEYNQRR